MENGKREENQLVLQYCAKHGVYYPVEKQRPGCPVCKAMAEIKKLKIEMNTLEYKFLLYREENCGVYHEREEE